MSDDDGYGKHRPHLHCFFCDDVVDLSFADVAESTMTITCKSCERPVAKPRVTLYGAPDGQELSRWTTGDDFVPVQFGRDVGINPEDIVLEEGTDAW